MTQVHDVPGDLAVLSGRPSDYADLFTVSVPGADRLSAEDWARTAIEGASPIGRFLAWRVLCGLRLSAERGPDWIGGWRIAARGRQWIRVEARSPLMSASMVFHASDDVLSFVTFVRYDRSVAAVTWPPVAAVHRRAAPGFLRQAVRRARRRLGSP